MCCWLRCQLRQMCTAFLTGTLINLRLVVVREMCSVNLGDLTDLDYLQGVAWCVQLRQEGGEELLSIAGPERLPVPGSALHWRLLRSLSVCRLCAHTPFMPGRAQFVALQEVAMSVFQICICCDRTKERIALTVLSLSLNMSGNILPVQARPLP